MLKNYRAVSNLHFLSNILERVVLQQLSDHMKGTDTLEPFQSANRTDHSTKLCCWESQVTCYQEPVSILLLLDLSAAFDTLENNVLLNTGWIACREYKTTQLVLSLADEGETIQSLCSDLCIGCQSELGLSTIFSPCAIIAKIHLLLLTYLIFYQPSRSLRSADADLMTVPRIKFNKYGKRASSYIGPVTWNSLPKPLRDAPSLPSFKSNLKTFLFKKHLYWRLSQSDPQGCWAKLTVSCVSVYPV